jgi:uncharacterized protein
MRPPDTQNDHCYQLAPICFDRIGSEIIVVNLRRKAVLLPERDFHDLIDGKVQLDSELFDKLRRDGFVYQSADEEFATSEAARVRPLVSHLFRGTSLHIIVATLDCPSLCIYCQASRGGMARLNSPTHMTASIAQRSVEIAFQSPAPSITIEFQGGEPLANFEVIKGCVTYAEGRSLEIGKPVSFQLVSSLALMDEEKLAFLTEHSISLCVSLDGPKALHDLNRPCRLGSSWDSIRKWVPQLRAAMAGRSPSEGKLTAIPTITRHSLGHATDIVSEYAELGFNSIWARPLSCFGRAHHDWQLIGYNASSFLHFYHELLDACIVHNKLNSNKIREGFATSIARSISTGECSHHTEFRSPCGAGIGQMLFDWDGRIYSCDEGRMAALLGDLSFQIGEVASSDYLSCMKSEPVLASAMASCLESHPDCYDCAYSPFCGVCPVYAHLNLGSINAKVSGDYRCEINKGMIREVLLRLLSSRGQGAETLLSWTRDPQADHYSDPQIGL